MLADYDEPKLPDDVDEALRDFIERRVREIPETLGELLAAGRYGSRLGPHYVVPMGAAIWSSQVDQMLDRVQGGDEVGEVAYTERARPGERGEPEAATGNRAIPAPWQTNRRKSAPMWRSWTAASQRAGRARRR